MIFQPEVNNRSEQANKFYCRARGSGELAQTHFHSERESIARVRRATRKSRLRNRTKSPWSTEISSHEEGEEERENEASGLGFGAVIGEAGPMITGENAAPSLGAEVATKIVPSSGTISSANLAEGFAPSTSDGLIHHSSGPYHCGPCACSVRFVHFRLVSFRF